MTDRLRFPRFLLDMLAGLNGLGSDFGRIARIDWQARDEGWLADDLALTCEPSVTLTEKVNVPAAVGLPEMMPPWASSVRPVGRVPETRLQPYGGCPPLAASETP